VSYGFKSASDMFNAERLFLNRMSMELPPTVVNEQPVKLHFIDTRAEDESEMT
jgi:hypothetical protein